MHLAVLTQSPARLYTQKQLKKRSGFTHEVPPSAFVHCFGFSTSLSLSFSLDLSFPPRRSSRSLSPRSQRLDRQGSPGDSLHLHLHLHRTTTYKGSVQRNPGSGTEAKSLFLLAPFDKMLHSDKMCPFPCAVWGLFQTARTHAFPFPFFFSKSRPQNGLRQKGIRKRCCLAFSRSPLPMPNAMWRGKKRRRKAYGNVGPPLAFVPSSFPVLLSKEQCNHRSSTVGSFLFFPSEVSLFSFGVVNEIPTPHGPCCWWCWFCLTIHLFASFSVVSKWFYTSSAICPMTHAFQGFPTALVHDQLTSTQVLQHLCHFRTIVLINSMTWAPIVAIAATFLLSFPFPFPC